MDRTMVSGTIDRGSTPFGPATPAIKSGDPAPGPAPGFSSQAG